MVILGLGSNLGDRLNNLRLAHQLIQKIPHVTVHSVSPIYLSDALLPENAPESWNIPYLNLAIHCLTTLSPLELLAQLKHIEFSIMGRKPKERWGPRIIDIDILVWDDLIQYDDKLHIPHENLHQRPFALWPLADIVPRWRYPLPGIYHGKTAAEMTIPWGSRFNGEAPFHTRQIPHRIDTAQLVGILNITPDSFSDGGKFTTAKTAFLHAQQLVRTGAEIIDIGGEATGPHAPVITPELEWQRLAPILEKILAENHRLLIPPKISIDTRHVATAKKALELGVNWINDVSGLDNPAMRELLAAQSCHIVVMHHLGIPVNKKINIPVYQDPVAYVLQWADLKLTQLEKQGITKERIILDVGIGYGKTREQSLELIHHIHQFHTLGVHLLIGHSRKVFLTLLTDHAPNERDIETAAFTTFLSQQKVNFLRVHNVDICARSLKVAARLV